MSWIKDFAKKIENLKDPNSEGRRVLRNLDPWERVKDGIRTPIQQQVEQQKQHTEEVKRIMSEPHPNFTFNNSPISGGVAAKNEGQMTGGDIYYYASAQHKTLAESAAEIQKLLKQLELDNPNPTDIQQIGYINDNTNPSFQRRSSSAVKALGESALDEFVLDNKYLKVIKATIKGWVKPE